MANRLIDGQAHFERDVDALLGDRLRKDDDFAVRFWSSLADISWVHTDGGVAEYSLRSSGDVIADIRNDGSEYTDWYFCGPRAKVDAEIEAALATLGWRWVPQ